MAQSLADSIRHFHRYWKNYLFQCSLVGAFIFAAVAYLGIWREVIVASIGASAFTVFCLPDNFTARPWNVIGGHLAGLLCGWLGTNLSALTPPEAVLTHAGLYALAVGLCCLIMVIIDVEHPPAAGTALGVAIEERFTLTLFVSLTAIVILLSLTKYLLRKYLVDLA